MGEPPWGVHPLRSIPTERASILLECPHRGCSAVNFSRTFDTTALCSACVLEPWKLVIRQSIPGLHHGAAD
eukprot:122078-Amphidinium_carterae.1